MCWRSPYLGTVACFCWRFTLALWGYCSARSNKYAYFTNRFIACNSADRSCVPVLRKVTSLHSPGSRSTPVGSMEPLDVGSFTAMLVIHQWFSQPTSPPMRPGPYDKTTAMAEQVRESPLGTNTEEEAATTNSPICTNPRVLFNDQRTDT